MAKILERTTMSISSLPSTCSLKPTLESYVSNPASSTVNLVLALDGGQYVGYIGYPDEKDLREERKSGDVLYHCRKIRSHDQVAKLGDKLDRETQVIIFPRWRNP